MEEEDNLDSFIDELVPSEEAEEVAYAWCVPLKNSGVAYLVPTQEHVYIIRCDEGTDYFYTHTIHSAYRFRQLTEYLMEIKSGKGNWIIDPDNDTSELRWSELDYKNATVIKRITKVLKEHRYIPVTEYAIVHPEVKNLLKKK